MASAFAVMIIWYTVWLKDNESPIDHVDTSVNASISDLSCQVWDIVGDGYCDDEANIPECGYDFRDCCNLENDRSLCTDCNCFLSGEDLVSYKDESCKICGTCGWYDYHIGDGYCNPGNCRFGHPSRISSLAS